MNERSPGWLRLSEAGALVAWEATLRYSETLVGASFLRAGLDVDRMPSGCS